MDRKMVEFIKEQYPPGTRIRLNSMDDPYAPIVPGTEGEVDFVDDIGQLHMKWDNGRTLALAPGEDSFSVLPPKLTTLKLYMPLTADLFAPNEYGDMDEYSELLEGHEAPGNCAIMINDEGEVVHQYCKMNPWIPTERHYPGWECPVTPGPKGSRIATIVCADGDYPEIWREAAYNGANVVVRITHYMNPWEEPWKLTNRCAAYCNQVYVVGANCYGMEHACAAFGNSMIINPDGNIVTEAPMMVPYLLKADLYPGLVDKLHESSTTNTFLYSFRHRGAACKELGGHGETRNQYKAYTFGGDEK